MYEYQQLASTSMTGLGTSYSTSLQMPSTSLYPLTYTSFATSITALEAKIEKLTVSNTALEMALMVLCQRIDELDKALDALKATSVPAPAPTRPEPAFPARGLHEHLRGGW